MILSGKRVTISITAIYAKESFDVSFLNSNKKPSLALISYSALIETSSVTIITLGYVLLRRFDECPLFNYTAMWRAICLNLPRSAEKKQKMLIKKKSK
jgi:hypothetical protein